jgi:hypothetical protein
MTDNVPIADASMLSRPANLVASEIDGEVIVMSIDSGIFFQLNAVGSRIWDALETPMTMADLCRALEDRFEVDHDVCRRDVTEFINLLADHDLVALQRAS